MKTIVIATEFSKIPGARYIKDGPFSGELFREMFLIPHFAKPGPPEMLIVNLDGAAGYATSFLEEAFGGLARRIGKQKCLDYIRFECQEDPFVVEEIRGYIEDVA